MIPSVACDLIPSRNEVYPLDMNPKKAIRQLKRVCGSLFYIETCYFTAAFLLLDTILPQDDLLSLARLLHVDHALIAAAAKGEREVALRLFVCTVNKDIDLAEQSVYRALLLLMRLVMSHM